MLRSIRSPVQAVLGCVRYFHRTPMAYSKVHPMSVTFLGTSSGGGPTENRNCSSLVCNLLPSGDLWMVDCAEGTTRQFQLQPETIPSKRVKISQVNRLFVTHMHADHIMGIPTLLRNRLAAPRVNEEIPLIHDISQRAPPKFEIYGPAGIRSFIRQNLKMTFTRSKDNYTVHELLTAHDAVTPCDPPATNSSEFDIQNWNVLHCNEVPGDDICADENGLWRSIYSSEGKYGCNVIVHAGPIHHRDPCLGYVFEEQTYPQRKVVVLGDTYDASPIESLCHNPCLLIHEATDATISPSTDNNGYLSKRSHQTVQEAAFTRGHSTPTMAGEFARRIGAQKLVLNHIGGRFPAPRVGGRNWGFADRVIADLQNQATIAWGSPYGTEAVVALDFMNVLVPLPKQDSNPNPNPNPNSLPIQGTPTSSTSFPINMMHSPYAPNPDAHPGYQTGQGRRGTIEMTEVEVIMENGQIEVEASTSNISATIHSNPQHQDHDQQQQDRVNKRDYNRSNTGTGSRKRRRNYPRDNHPRQ